MNEELLPTATLELGEVPYEEFKVIEERWEKFVQELESACDIGWSLRKFCAVHSNMWTIKIALLSKINWRKYEEKPKVVPSQELKLDTQEEVDG